MRLGHNIRFITAASLFDGHDAAIHVIRRMLQSEGAEVIHLGHNRSAYSVIKAAIEEDAQAIAVSSYQGGHLEYFTYMLELLAEHGASHINIYGGGGGVIVSDEIEILQSRGIKKIFSPDDGMRMGLLGMIESMLADCDRHASPPMETMTVGEAHRPTIGKTISTLELGGQAGSPEYKGPRDRLIAEITAKKENGVRAPIIGITGTGGAGKSSMIDELLLRFLFSFRDKRVAVLSVDPTRMRTGGALLGDRIRLNCADDDRVFVRSMATRGENASISAASKDVLDYLSLCDFDLVIFETAGIGQSDRAVSDLVDFSIYVMTPEFGAPSQLEKIGMLDYAAMVLINKFDKPGGQDALREVQKAFLRNHRLFDRSPADMPIYPTCANIFGDLGTNAAFNRLIEQVRGTGFGGSWDFIPLDEGQPAHSPIIPKKRSRYLAEIADAVRRHHDRVGEQAGIARRIDALDESMAHLKSTGDQSAVSALSKARDALCASIDERLFKDADAFFARARDYGAKEQSYRVRGREISVKNYHPSLSRLEIPRVKAPPITDRASAIRYVGLENLPGFFPFTAGAFPFKRDGEDPTRMFAGEGSPERTNKRFHYLSLDHDATRLSTAFDSVTLYGCDPDIRPDIYGKVGNAGVSVCSLDDMKRLYSGFDLIAPTTSVSMTINGPAPTMLAFFFNAAIDLEVERELKRIGRFEEIKKTIGEWFLERGQEQPIYRAQGLPSGHDGCGLIFLGLPSSEVVPTELYQSVKEKVLKSVRGTIQADILKEDQAQNTCIFSTEFSLRMMGDCQQYFIDNGIENFYSVSVSGYHIAEAGANPISQLAFTLANGFTLLEYYRARGMAIDDFAKNFSFFFSNGVDPEYAVIGRVARRIWAIALRDIYGANERSQKLKYHIQTSGRSLHAQEMSFNDIRTTLQALYAIADNCNSLHTNAFDEAITTPTEASVRRAVAIQMIINRELGLMKNENPWQGSYFLEYLTDEVEKAVLKVFDNLDTRGGVLGAMEAMYQRSTIQEDSLYYEEKKHSGELPIIGVNTFLDERSEKTAQSFELMRSTAEEKQMQVQQVHEFKSRFARERHKAIDELKRASLAGDNTFVHLMEATKYATLGEISQAFYEVGGAYRRAT